LRCDNVVGQTCFHCIISNNAISDHFHQGESDDGGNDFQADRPLSVDREEETQQKTIVLHNDMKRNDDVDSEDDEPTARLPGEMNETEVEVGNDVGNLRQALEIELRERRERRQALESQRDSRRKEGRPRNFLFVDNHTNKPYGIGKRQWRKELILLSESLDLAVGNINRHPEGAIEEIAE